MSEEAATRAARGPWAERWLSGALTTSLLCVALLVLVYPGRATNDTLGWLLQVRRNDLVDVQPPGAPLILGFLDPIWPGPYGLVAFNMILLSLGLMLFWAGHLRSVWAALAASIAVVGYPSVLSILPVAWRDISGLGLTLLTLAAAARLWRSDQNHLSWRHGAFLWGCTILLGIIGTLFRTNHAAGALPIVALALWPVMSRLLRGARVLSLAGAVSGALVLLVVTSAIAFALSASISRPVYMKQAWMLYRLAQMSVALQKNLLPEALYPRVGVAELQALLDASDSPYRNIFWTAYSRANNDLLPVITRAEQYQVLSDAFSGAVLKHPYVFATVSFNELRSFIDWRRVPGGSYYVDDQPSGIFKVASPEGNVLTLDINWPTETPALAKSLLDSWSKLAKPVLVRNPLAIMALAIVLTMLAVALRMPGGSLMIATVASSIAHFIGVAWFAPIFDFRFGHQSIAFALIAILLFATDLMRATRRSGQAIPPD